MQSGKSIFENNHAEKVEYKIAVFKILYKTLRTCQGNIPLLKTNFLEGKENSATIELAKQIETYCLLKPNSRTAKAWGLAEKHYQNCNIENVELFNEIYQYVCKNKTHFGSTFFSQFKNPAPLTYEKIAHADLYQDKMIYNIKFWLETNISENMHSAKKKNSDKCI